MVLQTITPTTNHFDLPIDIPDNYVGKKLKIAISPELEEMENPIKKLRGKLNLSDKHYQEIQEFLNEDR